MKRSDIDAVAKLLEIMAALLDPKSGCPWDCEQTFETIAPYTIEEAYEVADAIERGDVAALEDELGDLLFQVAFHSRIAEEQGAFGFGDVARRICEKMIRRHPHVFAGADRDRAAHAETWEALKRQEQGPRERVLDGVPVGLPALTRAVKLGRRAGRVGFDWPDPRGPREKVDEELGDVLFALANLARHLDVDPEQCARGANLRFESRFDGVERRVRASGRAFDAHSMDELEAFWQAAKAEESEPPER